MALLARATGGSEKAAVTKSWRHCLHLVRVELVASFGCRCFIRHVVRVLLIIVVVAAVHVGYWCGVDCDAVELHKNKK